MSHSKKLKVLVHSNHSRLVTGFGKNTKNIMMGLHNDPDIELIEVANGSKYGADALTPWESCGSYPTNPSVLQQIQGDGAKERMAQYGFYCIDDIVEKYKPDVYLGVEDIWAFTQYEQKPWWNKINKVLWTTLDSLPILDQALHMEPLCDKMLVWASFAEKEMKRLGYKNVETLHGAVDYTSFYPLKNRNEIRKKFGIDDCFVIGFVFKNQLRKSVPNLLQGFKTFKEENPNVKAKLLLHTDWGEVGSGWDIPRYIKEMGIDPEDILSTYVCHACDFYYVAPYQGEDKNCPSCNKEKTFKTKSSIKGIGEKELNELYNCMDVYCHPFTSGGQELPIQEAKAAGLITLVTEYSCGTDSCYEDQGGIPLKWNEYREPQTQFIKASTCPKDIANKLSYVYKMDDVDKWQLSVKAMKYVRETFSTERICKKLKEILLNLKKPEIKKEEEKQNQKALDLQDVLDDEGVENRIAVILPESAGDVLILNSLMENLKSLYPEKNIYVFTKPQFYQMIEDNPSIHKMLPYSPQLENLLFLEGRGNHQGYFDMAFLPNIGTQRHLNYLHNGKDKTQFELR
tara:strand:+ start:4820 stop:6529 length:1710 start_codon:yes stop_codon:yes gene_type:complete